MTLQLDTPHSNPIFNFDCHVNDEPQNKANKTDQEKDGKPEFGI
jgi:hypothetical protein